MKRIIFHSAKRSYLDKDKNEKEIIHEVRFLDSAKFMASSLDSLVKNLRKDKLHHVRREFGGKTDLISRKGVYPYDWITGIGKRWFRVLKV